MRLQIHRLLMIMNRSPVLGTMNFLPKNASKGEGLMHLADLMMLTEVIQSVSAITKNDLALVKMANVGVAVSNAVDEVKRVADFITVDNNSSAVAAVIYALDDGKLNLNNVIMAVRIDYLLYFVVATLGQLRWTAPQWEPCRKASSLRRGGTK